MSSRFSPKIGIRLRPVWRKVAAAVAAETVEGSETISGRGVMISATSVRVSSTACWSSSRADSGRSGSSSSRAPRRRWGSRPRRSPAACGASESPGEPFDQPLDLAEAERQRRGDGADDSPTAGQGASMIVSAKTLPITPART